MKELFRVFDMEGISTRVKITMMREVEHVWSWENTCNYMHALTESLIAILEKRTEIEQVKE